MLPTVPGLPAGPGRVDCVRSLPSTLSTAATGAAKLGGRGRDGKFDGTGRGLAALLSIADFQPAARANRGGFLAVGNFDGVHRGHDRLIGRLRERAEAVGAPAIALTFDPSPASVLRPRLGPPPLTVNARKVELLRAAGADEVGVFRTGPWLLGLTAREFFDRVVIGQFGAVGMVEGPTFGFGRDRGGDARLLADWCESAGLGFEVVEPTEIDGRLVSSSRVRAALSEGDVAEAARLLGRPHRLTGKVVRGAGRGAGLGFPTANLGGFAEQAPADGVYAALAQLESGGPKPAALHVGPNATFDARERTVEAHLLDFDGDLYGQRMGLDLIDRVRPSRKFEGVDDLIAQVADDLKQVRVHIAAWRVADGTGGAGAEPSVPRNGTNASRTEDIR